MEHKQLNSPEEITQKNEYQAQIFANRAQKNYRQLKKWARKNRINAFRIYDRDIPEVPLAADLYTFLPSDITDKIECAKFTAQENDVISSNSPLSIQYTKDILARSYILLYLYERPYEKDPQEEEKWLLTMKKSLAQAIEIPEENIILKTRRHQSDSSGNREQYKKNLAETRLEGIIQEQGQLFKVNLSDYLDSGIFPDHRNLRKSVRENCSGKAVLNLFCYTGSFSVYAAEGKASYVESVDMSNTYLNWAKENMELNGFSDNAKYHYTRQDVFQFLENAKNSGQKFDLIILDPPTFSNSKKTENTLDINRDWNILCADSLTLLNSNGVLYFSTNSRRIIFDQEKIATPEGTSIECKEITPQTISQDYRNQKIHRVWKIVIKEKSPSKEY